MKVEEHYGRSGLAEAVARALKEAGLGDGLLEPAALAAFDQFHLRGLDATRELARLAGIGAGERVLDVGGGLGGPARVIAHERGCHVTVLDLTEAFCAVGADLTRRAGLADRVRFQHGSALDMPFADGAFDVVWTQHSSMNVGDKERLYAEIARVLRTGGRLAIHEIMAGPGGPVHFPVPWAREPGQSWLRPPERVRALIAAAGLEEMAWRDESATAREWLRARLAAAAPGPRPALGLHLVLGEDAPVMFRTLLRNLEEERIAVVMGAWERR